MAAVLPAFVSGSLWGIFAVLDEALDTGRVGMVVLAMAATATAVATVELARSDTVATNPRPQAELRRTAERST